MKRLSRAASDKHDYRHVKFSWHPDGKVLSSVKINGKLALYIDIYL